MKRPGSSKQIHSRRFCVLTMITITLVVLSACQSTGTGATPILTASPTLRIISAQASYITATSIEELTRKSTLVVTGWATQMGNVINIARDVNDFSKPDPHLYGIGQIYQFKIDQILKGANTIGKIEAISIVQPEDMFRITPGVPVTQAEIDKARYHSQFIPIRLNSKYLLFLEPLMFFNDLPNHFTGVAALPWRFDISNPDRIVPESEWDYAAQYFPPQSWPDVLAKVENPQGQRDQTTPEPPPYP